jgi:hypothetical protein
MSQIAVTLEVDSPEQAALLRQFHALVTELQALALSAPEGQVMDLCEDAVLRQGQRVNREVLRQAVQRRIEALEKKSRRCAPARAAGHVRTAAEPDDKS